MIAVVTVTFRTRGARLLLVVSVGVFLILVLGAIFRSNWSVGHRALVYGFAALYGAMRVAAFRGSSTTLDETVLEVRGFLRTRRWSLESVREVRTEIGQVGIRVRRYLVVVPQSGPEVSCTAVNEVAWPIGELEVFVRAVNNVIKDKAIAR